MSLIFTILVFIQTNAAVLLQAQQALCFALSSFFQMVKMPKTSKFFGTFGVDGGRVIRWLGGLGLTAKPKSWLEFALKLASKSKTTAALLLIALNTQACAGKQVNTPINSLTAIEVATAAVNSTDSAVATAIELERGGDYGDAVDAVDAAMAAVRRRSRVCEAMPALQAAALRVKCSKCDRLISAAKEVLSCPQ